MKVYEEKLNMITERLFDNKLCLICYEDIEGDALISPCCKNIFCKACIESWFNTGYCRGDDIKCPYCKHLNAKDEFLLFKLPEKHEDTASTSQNNTNEAQDSDSSTEVPKSKLETIEYLLSEKAGEKVIIFSNYPRFFKNIAERLTELQISYIELDGGNISAVDHAANMYKHGSTRVLLSNSSFYGCGMNLENTSDIIFVHRTEEAMFNQVIGRAQRPGRTGQLNVYRLYHNNE
jgi:SNF2 family DNA or RNA helicase